MKFLPILSCRFWMISIHQLALLWNYLLIILSLILWHGLMKSAQSITTLVYVKPILKLILACCCIIIVTWIMVTKSPFKLILCDTCMLPIFVRNKLVGRVLCRNWYWKLLWCPITPRCQMLSLSIFMIKVAFSNFWSSELFFPVC